jgi:tetratricopeptide (TPR) repeat protein
MKLSLTFTSALVAGIAAFVTVTPAFAAASKNTNTEKVAKLLAPAQELLKAKNYSGALAQIRQAQAIPDKNAFDVYTIAEFACQANIGAGNYADAAKACEEQLNNSFMTEANVPRQIHILQALNYQIKNYDKSIEFGQRAVKAGTASEEDKTILGQAYYLKGDWKDTISTENSLVDAEIKAGQIPKDQQLGLILNSCIKLEDTACQEKALEKLVAYYPKPEYWQVLLQHVTSATSGGSNDTNTLQLYRLMFDTDTLKQPADFNEAAQLAVDAGSPGEAQRILERGFTNNVFTDQRIKDRNTRLLETVKKTSAADQASLAKGERDADAAPTGAKNVAVGLAYLGYGQYDKAVEQIQKGIQKGGLRNEADAHLLLGIAQLKAGHKEEAVKSFKTVKGDPMLEKLASLWVLHARQA